MMLPIKTIKKMFKGNIGKKRETSVVVENPGDLPLLITKSEASGIVSLKLAGVLNGEDMIFVHRFFKSLVKLDLADVEFVNDLCECGVHSCFFELRNRAITVHSLHIPLLRDVTLPRSVEKVELYGMSLKFGGIEDEAEMRDNSSPFLRDLLNIDVPDDNRLYSSQDGILYNKDKTELLRCPMAKCGEVVIPSTVKIIRGQSFSDCNHITSIKMNEGLNCIGSKAFYGCGKLKTLEIPASVTMMGGDVFSKCEKLRSLRCNIVSPIKLDLKNVSAISNCVLMVPYQSVDDYDNAPLWTQFKKIIPL